MSKMTEMGDKRQKFRAWYIPQIPGKPFLVYADTYAKAQFAEEVMGKLSLFEFENRIKPDYADAGGVEKWDDTDGEWYEVDPEDQEDQS